ncbi:MAG: ATP-binding protein [Acidimicrobiia bacterium]
MRRLATVRVRVTIAAVVVVGIALAAGAVWLVDAHRASLRHDVESAARLRADEIAAILSDGTFPEVLAVPRGDDNLVQVVDAHGQVVAASAKIEAGGRISNLQPGVNGSASRRVRNVRGAESPYEIVARAVKTKSGDYTVYVARSLESVSTSVDSLERLLLIGLPILLVLVGAITWIVVDRALRPVESIRREVDSIGARDLHRRVPEPGTPDEIGRLAITMNAMLTRLEDANERQRRFVADASHELRNPITGIRAQLEVDLAHPEQADWQATERDMLVDSIRLQRLVDDLLLLAITDESAIDASSRAPVDLDEIVLAEARRLRSRTVHRVDTSGVSGAQLLGNREQLTRTIRNLFDNADRYARSTITVTLSESDDAITLVVHDDGPGIPSDQQERIFERFTRLDDARTSDSGGTGLGLAITREVVIAHGGTISVDGSSGARFTLSFPLQPHAAAAPPPAELELSPGSATG